MDININDMLTVPEAAKRLRAVSGIAWPTERTVSRWVDAGLLTGVRLRRGSQYDRRIHPESVEEMGEAIRRGWFRPRTEARETYESASTIGTEFSENGGAHPA